MAAIGPGRWACESTFRPPLQLAFAPPRNPERVEATREIRSQEPLNGTRVPIVALTAHATKGDREVCFDPDRLLLLIACLRTCANRKVALHHGDTSGWAGHPRNSQARDR